MAEPYSSSCVTKLLNKKILKIKKKRNKSIMVFVPLGEILRNPWKSEMKRIRKTRTQKPQYKTKLWGGEGLMDTRTVLYMPTRIYQRYFKLTRPNWNLTSSHKHISFSVVPYLGYGINIHLVTQAKSLRLIFIFTSFLLACMRSSNIILM